MSNETHTLEPFFEEDSRILILGSFPSVASRAKLFYYAHPSNRFWPLLSMITGMDANTLDQRKELLKSAHIALYDVIESCSIEGSADSKIKDVVPSNLSIILNKSPIKAIFTNGRKAETLYKRYLEKDYGKAISLPSTSSANAASSIDKLFESWKVIRKYI